MWHNCVSQTASRHLASRGNLAFRVRVPADLVATVGKTHVNRTLGTAAYPDALARCRIVALEVADWFEAVRAGGSTTFCPSIARPSLQAPPRLAPDRLGITLAEAWERYLADPSSTRTRKTTLAYETVRNVVVSVLGADTLVADVGRQDCRRVLDTLRHLPPNYGKKWPDMTPPAIAEMAVRDGLRPMAAANCNGYMTRFAGMMNWLVKEELAERNPCIGLRIADPVPMKDKRRPFSTGQLQRIFSGPPFEALGNSSTSGFKPSCPSRFYVPLIALFSGLRQNEICQQTTDDIADVDGVPCFIVKSDPMRGKRVKTASSERAVPVHPALVRAGLLDHHRKRCSSDEPRMWPDLALDRFGYASAYFSKWFARYLAQEGAKLDRTSFHSFRHCFRDSLRAGGVEREIAFALGGWSGSRSGAVSIGDLYGSGFPMKALREAISCVSYDVDALRPLLGKTSSSPPDSCATHD